MTFLNTILPFTMTTILLISGCPSYPNVDRYIKEKPNDMDLIGTWKSDDGSETIELKKDYSCIASGTIIFDQFNETYNQDIIEPLKKLMVKTQSRRVGKTKEVSALH